MISDQDIRRNLKANCHCPIISPKCALSVSYQSPCYYLMTCINGMADWTDLRIIIFFPSTDLLSWLLSRLL